MEHHDGFRTHVVSGDEDIRASFALDQDTIYRECQHALSKIPEMLAGLPEGRVKAVIFAVMYEDMLLFDGCGGNVMALHMAGDVISVLDGIATTITEHTQIVPADGGVN